MRVAPCAGRLLLAGLLATAWLSVPALAQIDVRQAAVHFSGEDDSRAPRFRVLRDSANDRIAGACAAGTTVAALERAGIQGLGARLDSLAVARVVRVNAGRCEAGFPVLLGERRRALAAVADSAAARMAPFLDSLLVQLGSLARSRPELVFHLLWSRVMDEGASWSTAWHLTFPADSLPAVSWIVVPERRLAVGTDYSQVGRGGSLALTWSRRFTEHLAPLGDLGFELTQLGWWRPVENDSARATFAALGVTDSAGRPRLFSYHGRPGLERELDGAPLVREVAALDDTLRGMAVAYGARVAVAADWRAAASRLGIDPRDFFVIAAHEVAYSALERLEAAGRLAVPRVLTEGAPRTDAVQLVSLALGASPRPGDAALAAYWRNGWHGNDEVVRRLEAAAAATPGDIEVSWALGLSLYDVGRYRDAVGTFLHVTELAAGDSARRLQHDWAQIWMGHAYDALRERARALAVYRLVVQTGDRSGWMQMGQYGIGPVSAPDWARQRLKTPFRPPR